MIVTGVL